MNRVIFGDCRETMRSLKAQGVRVQCCVTSPPYFGLRDYGHPGQIGLEKTPSEYVTALLEVFACVSDLLADDGVLWLNLGDSYAGSRQGPQGEGSSLAGNGHQGGGPKRHTIPRASHNLGGGPQSEHLLVPRSDRSIEGLKPKDLIGIPWRVAFALQASGWYLRQDIIWHKPNPMPESVTDRCTKAHEYLFLLSKSKRYYWDAAAMQEPATGKIAGNLTPQQLPGQRDGANANLRNGLHAYAERQRIKRDSFKRDNSKRAEVIPGQSAGTHRADRDESAYDVSLRNRRSVWTVPTHPYAGSHFAVFPPALIEPCILAGSRPGDVVLDPFMGSGTTAQVAQALNRRWLGCELNPEYASLQIERTAQASLAIESWT